MVRPSFRPADEPRYCPRDCPYRQDIDGDIWGCDECVLREQDEARAWAIGDAQYDAARDAAGEVENEGR